LDFLVFAELARLGVWLAVFTFDGIVFAQVSMEYLIFLGGESLSVQ
jgi:hypothetical protein